MVQDRTVTLVRQWASSKEETQASSRGPESLCCCASVACNSSPQRVRANAVYGGHHGLGNSFEQPGNGPLATQTHTHVVGMFTQVQVSAICPLALVYPYKFPVFTLS